MRKFNILIGLISVGMGGLILLLSKDMSMFDEYGVPGERFWPYGLAWLFIGLGILQWAVVIKDRLSTDKPVDLSSKFVRLTYILSAIAVVYGIALYWAGFILSAIIFIPITMLFMNERRIGYIALSTILIVAAVYLSFTYLFNSPLPTSVFSES
ncbi:tripartite tricarboxylate transporter TctB family protein [Brenneria tiliae]|uniref:tripartite tricarboxylate transporter TctB family protein n=1 Tax=Brenneria tiliae TaxID=2914984 RepID=UPI0020149D01|nr:tripartite tricarboxylate transporter TctB family protein [Brenneria tiliae]MCL2899540.1 tripartite tricarboxylate transporter TctB family protein [Brenneria tiliae]MCL2903918.1 tripartite tricarboxylate transporter TctB family protein [Brenneria tiliae]